MKQKLFYTLSDLDGLTNSQLTNLIVLQFIFWSVAGWIVFEIIEYITTGHWMAWD